MTAQFQLESVKIVLIYISLALFLLLETSDVVDDGHLYHHSVPDQHA